MSYRFVNSLAEKGLLPDFLLRAGIRYLLKQRLIEVDADCAQQANVNLTQLVEQMREAPIAALPNKANEQHYELPGEFFKLCLGEHHKYSCGYWADDEPSLDNAEQVALQKSCEHANLSDGLRVLELGCGWGSLTLYMAKQFPNSEIVAVSNSSSQGEWIRNKSRSLGLSNVTVITDDMNNFEPEGQFDRVVSVEMFEHMRNWDTLFNRVQNWLKPGGAFFIHIFVHRSTPYFFEDNDDSDWMTRYFFAGGLMPSIDLPLFFQNKLKIDKRWIWNGRHYQRTSNAWLKQMDHNKSKILPVLEEVYGQKEAKVWWVRWRLFYMACAELFGYQQGNEWFVGHYRFIKEGSKHAES